MTNRHRKLQGFHDLVLQELTMTSSVDIFRDFGSVVNALSNKHIKKGVLRILLRNPWNSSMSVTFVFSWFIFTINLWHSLQKLENRRCFDYLFNACIKYLVQLRFCFLREMVLFRNHMCVVQIFSPSLQIASHPFRFSNTYQAFDVNVLKIISFVGDHEAF